MEEEAAFTFVYIGETVRGLHRGRRATTVELYPITYNLQLTADSRQCFTAADQNTVILAPCDPLLPAQQWEMSNTGLLVSQSTNPRRCLNAVDGSNQQVTLATCNPRAPGQLWGVSGSSIPEPVLANTNINVCLKTCEGFTDKICGYKETDLSPMMCLASDNRAVNGYVTSNVFSASGPWASALPSPTPATTPLVPGTGSEPATTPTTTFNPFDVPFGNPTTTSTTAPVAGIATTTVVETPTYTVTESPATSDSSSGGTSAVAIVAIAIAGAVIALLLLLGLAWCLYRRRHQRNKIGVTESKISEDGHGAGVPGVVGFGAGGAARSTVGSNMELHGSAAPGGEGFPSEAGSGVVTYRSHSMNTAVSRQGSGGGESGSFGSQHSDEAMAAAAAVPTDLLGNTLPGQSTTQLTQVGKTTIVLECPHAEDDEEVALVGNKPSLGMWRPESAPRMRRLPNDPHVFTLTLANVSSTPIEYKFCKINERLNNVTWMGGDPLTLESTDVDVTQSYAWNL